MFPTKCETNLPVQSQKQARGLKYWLLVEEELYCPSSENKGADQLSKYCTADLRFCFHICKKSVFSRCGSCTHEITPLLPLSDRFFPSFIGKESLRRLVKEGIKCSYVLINAVSYVMMEVMLKFALHCMFLISTVFNYEFDLLQRCYQPFVKNL